jgi:hypothetical protein
VAVSRGSGAGGIAGLAALIDQHGEALDADLQHHYPGRSLADLVAGRMTFRQLHVLVKGLPGDGTAMWRAGARLVRKGVKGSPPPADWWTPERDLLASVIDAVSVLIWLNTEDARKGKNRPKPIPRPGIPVPEGDTATLMSAKELRAILRPVSQRSPRSPR